MLYYLSPGRHAMQFVNIGTHKVLCGTAPRYLRPFKNVANVPGRRCLHSYGTSRLVPPFRLSTVGSRAFPVAAANIWNAPPDSLVSIASLQSFRRHLKTFSSVQCNVQHWTEYKTTLASLRPSIRPSVRCPSTVQTAITVNIVSSVLNRSSPNSEYGFPLTSQRKYFVSSP